MGLFRDPFLPPPRLIRDAGRLCGSPNLLENAWEENARKMGKCPGSSRGSPISSHLGGILDFAAPARWLVGVFVRGSFVCTVVCTT